MTDDSVYVLGSIEHGWYKIGRSSRVDKRISEWHTSLPFATQVFHIERGLTAAQSRRLEKELHMRFIHHNIRGEWFHDVDLMELHRFLVRWRTR